MVSKLEFKDCGNQANEWKPCIERKIADQVFGACCDRFAPPECRGLCIYESNPIEARVVLMHAIQPSRCRLYKYLSSIIHCAAQTHDNTACCRDMGVHEIGLQCLQLCKPQAVPLQLWGTRSLRKDLVVCLAKWDQIMFCHQAGLRARKIMKTPTTLINSAGVSKVVVLNKIKLAKTLLKTLSLNPLERKKLSHEKKEMRSQLKGEITELRANIAKMNLMIEKAGTFCNEPTNQMKHELQNLSEENVALKSKLTETHLELAIIKSELAIIRTDYESRKKEMSGNSKALFENAQQTKFGTTIQTALLTSSPMRVLYDTSNAKPRETHSAYNTDENTIRNAKVIFENFEDFNSRVDFYVKSVSIDGKNVAIQLWDTAGQERFRSLCKSYFRRADAAILVYDCTVEGSFLSVRDWIAAIKAVGVLFAECSALNGINIEGALMNLIRELIVTEDVEISGTGVIIMSKFSKEISNCCCLKN
ncbi:unnamed protein product [Brugia pahangi]|uniref:DB domain-containing protein n=1 Tax=Brugia pahangi TaxID=6280 RepID=A0A0N4TXY3_BRUPA|nr:unnamed protein product [Brugia pahangi]